MSPEQISRPDIGYGRPGCLFPSPTQASSIAISEEHSHLTEWKDTKGSFSSLLSGIPYDPWLKKLISDRDIVFIMDNAATMKRHWAVATRVLETIAMKIGPLDTDGIDLFYTIDGLWEGCTNRGDVEKCITSFLEELRGKLRKRQSRWFSIQFISFGEDAHDLERLRQLDDHMPTEEDVIDTKPWWYHDFSKLILGGITDVGDRDEPPSLSPTPSTSRALKAPTSTTLSTPKSLERKTS